MLLRKSWRHISRKHGVLLFHLRQINARLRDQEMLRILEEKKRNKAVSISEFLDKQNELETWKIKCSKSKKFF